LEFIIQSKALYSTWVYYKPNRILFDCGEGISEFLGNKIYGIDSIYITHSHIDHISGLWGLVNIRNNGMGSREKPLQIYYPNGARQFEEYMTFIFKMNKRLRYDIITTPLELSQTVSISPSRYIKPFRTKHTPGEASYGFQIIEIRNRLKETYRSLSQEEIKKNVELLGKAAITENYEYKVLTLSGDSLAIPTECALGSEILIHECTFFNENDRKIRNHTSLRELTELISKTHPKRVIIYHISSRYERILLKKEKELKELFPEIDIVMIKTQGVTEI